MRKAIAILPVVSAIYPMITGATAPPTIGMISNEEASLVFVPASLNASENIVGNMILSPRYRAKNAMRDKVPLHTTTINVATKVRMAQVSIPKPNAITRIGFSSTISFVSASCALLGSGNVILDRINATASTKIPTRA